MEVMEVRMSAMKPNILPVLVGWGKGWYRLEKGEWRRRR